MKVSVLMSVHNRAGLIERSLRKYTQQTYRDFELVIVDDGSTDNLKRVLSGYRKVMDIQYVRLNRPDTRSPNTGWLAAMDAARGDFWILTHPEILVSRDAIRVMVNTYAAVNTQRPVGKERRVSFSFYSLNQRMTEDMDTVDWKENIDNLQSLSGFFTTEYRMGTNHLTRLRGGISIGFTGQRKVDWDSIGRFHETAMLGYDDPDLHTRETMAQRAAYCPPHIRVYHQWHEVDAQERAEMVESAIPKMVGERSWVWR